MSRASLLVFGVLLASCGSDASAPTSTGTLAVAPSTDAPETTLLGCLVQPKSLDEGLVIPTPPSVGTGDRDQFAEDMLGLLGPALQGVAVDAARAALVAAGWTVTLVDTHETQVTYSPDLLWDRLVLVVCDRLVESVYFD